MGTQCDEEWAGCGIPPPPLSKPRWNYTQDLVPDEPDTDTKIEHILEWANFSTAARRVGFDTSTVQGIRDWDGPGYTSAQIYAIDNIYSRWKIAKWRANHTR